MSDWPLEGEFQSAAITSLNAAGRPTRFHRQNAGRFRSLKGDRIIHGAPKGAADLSGILRPTGTRLELELKSPTAPWTAAQRRWRRYTLSFGGVYLLCRYDPKLTLERNVELVVEAVDAAVAARCAA